MSLRGQLDFQRPFLAEKEELLLYFPFEQGSHFVLPDRIALSTDTNGMPDFRLSLVHGVMPDLPPTPYGQVCFGLKTEGPAEKAMLALQSMPHSNNTGLTLAAYQRGFLRWRTMGTPLPTELQTPSPLRFDGLATSQWSTILSPESALLLKQSQLEGLLILNAVAELDISGVAARLPVQVRFDPNALLNDLLQRADPTGLLPTDALMAYFRQPFSQLPLTVIGSVSETFLEEWAFTMSCLVRLRYGALAAAIDPMLSGPCIQLTIPQKGEVMWDLSVPTLVTHSVCLMLDPVVTAAKLAQLTNLADFWQEVIVRTLPTGHLPIRIFANLPANRANILTLGVNITAPPHASRPRAIHQTLELAAPNDEINTFLRLSPIEPLQFQYQPFAIIDGPDGVTQLLAEEQSSGTIAFGETCHLLLNPADFAVNFITIEATSALLSLARVRVRLEMADGWIGAWIMLDNHTPNAALAWSQNSPLPNLHVEASALDSEETRALPNHSFQSILVGPEAFRGYGLHEIEISYHFDDGSSLIAIELLPEDKDDLPVNRSVLFLTPATPQKTWQYFAGSPFKPGFRYRVQTVENVAPWSPIQSFISPLVIRKPLD